MDYEVILVTPEGAFGIDDPSRGPSHSKRLDTRYAVIKNSNELILVTPDGSYEIGDNVSGDHFLTDIVQMKFAGFYLVYFDVRSVPNPDTPANAIVAPLTFLGFL